MLTFTVATCSSQNQIFGNYCYSFNTGDGNCIEFKSNNRFDWKSTGDLGTYYVGTGEYSFEDEMLVLNFDNNIETSRSKVKIRKDAN